MKILVLLLIPFLSALSSYGQNPKIELKTALGSIIAELYLDKAPITCENFIKYIEQDKFDSAHFYRVVRMDNQPDNDIKIEVIQGGLGFDRLDSGFPPIQHETTSATGILHKDGVFNGQGRTWNSQLGIFHLYWRSA